MKVPTTTWNVFPYPIRGFTYPMGEKVPFTPLEKNRWYPLPHWVGYTLLHDGVPYHIRWGTPYSMVGVPYHMGLGTPYSMVGVPYHIEWGTPYSMVGVPYHMGWGTPYLMVGVPYHMG